MLTLSVLICNVAISLNETLMPPKTTTSSSDLARTIANLQKQRDQHAAAIAEIDDAFAKFGVKPGGKRGPGRPKGSGAKPKGQKKRGRFAKTAEQFVLDLIKKNKQLTTREINVRWNRTGRGGAADNTLYELTKDKLVKRDKIKGGLGSNYSLAKGGAGGKKKTGKKKSAAKKAANKKITVKKVVAKPETQAAAPLALAQG